MRAATSALVPVLLVATGCIHVHERVQQHDRTLDQPRVVEQRDQLDQVLLEADYGDGSLELQLQRQTPCQRRYQARVERVEQTRRTADPGSYIAMGLEVLGGLAAGLGSAWVFTARDVEFQGGEAGRVLNGVACLGLSGWLLGSFGYHVFYLLQSPEQKLTTDDSYWGPVETCAREPLRRTPVRAHVGSVELDGTSDEQGRVVLSAPAGVELGSLLAGADWKLRVQLASPRLERVVQVYQREAGTPRPAAGSPAASTSTPVPSNSETATPAAATSPATTRALPAAAATSSDEPPLPDGPPEGAVLLPATPAE